MRCITKAKKHKRLVQTYYCGTVLVTAALHQADGSCKVLTVVFELCRGQQPRFGSSYSENEIIWERPVFSLRLNGTSHSLGPLRRVTSAHPDRPRPSLLSLLHKIVQKSVDKCMGDARQADSVEIARHHESEAQKAAEASSLVSVPELTAEELAVIAQKDMEKCMKDARQADTVNSARYYESSAQEAAKAGGLSSFPKLTAEELVVIAQKDLNTCMKYARQAISVEIARYHESDAQKAAVAAKAGGLTTQHPKANGKRAGCDCRKDVDTCIENARQAGSLNSARHDESDA
ncbi:hypothetical protein BDW02DRAFT_584713 [Decorospora gaudefroyi]|uniref:Uncharacterized protein n=1 Tax=Decorospora gaudefroyi TaxID=184978 RepID=A0A6A5K0R2_9PLEO|nr:hypothetical protein BDW02DRAFT_584713 [Decorospora gaudefroyi]